MKRIWLVRHGQSMAQTQETGDHLNPDLSALGAQQAQRLADRLGDIPFERILISPLIRAWRTFELSGLKAKKAQFDSRVAESNWEQPDFYASILPVLTPDIAKPDRHDAWRMDPAERSASLIRELVAGQEENVALFGHWGIFSIIFRTITGVKHEAPILTASMSNACVSLFEYNDDGNITMPFWNDSTHVMDILT